jgi:hypothetical protein
MFPMSTVLVGTLKLSMICESSGDRVSLGRRLAARPLRIVQLDGADLQRGDTCPSAMIRIEEG